MTDPMKLRARLPAPIEAVRGALTDPVALRAWLAEHAEVELPDRFAFWGRYTPQGDTARQTLEHVDDHTLRFTWALGGADTTVEVRLEGSEGSTVVNVSHIYAEGQEVVAGYPADLALGVFWSLAVMNLADHLAGRATTPMCDYTAGELRAEILIAASPEAVFESLVDSAAFSQWFGLKVEIEPYPGGRWAIPDGGPVGRVLHVEPGVRVWLEEDSGIAAWELAGAEGGTVLTFAFTGADQEHPPYASWTGWLCGIASLRRYHELNDWQPIWLDPT